MYAFESKTTLESKTIPGVSFTIRKMTDARRAKFRLQNADILAELTSKFEQRDAPGITDVAKHRAGLEIEIFLADKINPAWLSWGLISVSGVIADGADVTPANLADGPEELYNEIVGAIKTIAQMTEAEIKNLLSPTTSGLPVVGETSDTTAPDANGMAISEPETVVSISQS